MRRLYIKRKTGFKVKDPYKPIIIRDSRGILFYDTTPIIPKVKRFNLPGGFPLYLESGNIEKLPKPVRYKLSRLPIRERYNKPKPFNFRIKFSNNPNKATIFWNHKAITFDSDFLEMPIPMVYFILFHEFGHRLYKTEKYADLYAKNMMLKRGFNPTQIGLAQIYGLSPKNIERKRYIIRKLIKK